MTLWVSSFKDNGCPYLKPPRCCDRFGLQSVPKLKFGMFDGGSVAFNENVQYDQISLHSQSEVPLKAFSCKFP
jgi:hypothetical protein